jgi:predicted unusual protein kinase regulating ubiquinone biosynthesis (AarF/ABC1/UbiB family)
MWYILGKGITITRGIKSHVYGLGEKVDMSRQDKPEETEGKATETGSHDQMPTSEVPDEAQGSGSSSGLSAVDGRQPLEEGSAVPTSRVGRFLKTGWAARHAVPLALKRTAEVVTSEKEDRKEAVEKLLEEQEAVAEELFRTLGQLKGVVQKFGQMASYLEGVLPSDVAPVYQKVLSKLQDSAPALPPDEVRKAIEDELDCYLEDHFAEFEEQPFAAASIGQVHRALLYDGTTVAVKVQYPGIDRAFDSDLKNIKMLEMLFTPIISYYRGKETLEMFRQQLLDELDYEREADAHERFRDIFEGHEHVYIPQIYRELCTKKLLVTEFVEGSTFAQVCESDESVRTQAGIGLATYLMESLHHHRMINVDPHPGNTIFMKDGRICCIDFGAVVDVEAPLLSMIERQLKALWDEDIPAFQESLHELYGVAEDVDPVVLEAQTMLALSYLAPLQPGKQPFRFSTEWISGCVDEGMDAARQILLRGGRVPKMPPPPTHVYPGMASIYRVVVGIGSLLSKLHVSHDWCKLYQQILENREE